VGWTYWLRLTLLRLVAEAGVEDASSRAVRTLHIILENPAACIPEESVRARLKRARFSINHV
jgi:hypothetical protein